MLPSQDSECRATLIRCLTEYSTTQHEIEYRIQDVGLDEFEHLLEAVRDGRTQTKWTMPPQSNVPPKLVRETQHAADCERTWGGLEGNTNPTQVVRRTYKERLGPIHHHHHKAFVAAASLVASADSSPVTNDFTYRQIDTFQRVSGGSTMLLLELTRVKSGPTDEQAREADTRYQISIKVQGGSKAMPKYLADSLLMKAEEILQMIVPLASNGPSPSKRSRSLPPLPPSSSQVPARSKT